MVHLNKGFSLNWAAPQLSRRTGSRSDEQRCRGQLVSIILATKSSRGESIVFHYPPEVDNKVQDSADVSGAGPDAESDMDDEFVLSLPSTEQFERRQDGHLPTIQEREMSQDDSEDTWIPPWRTILGLDTSLLADVLTPQVSDHKFEMWIDNLVFLGSPVQLNTHKLHSKPENSREDTDLDLANSSLMTTFHVVFALESSIDATYHKQISDLFENVVSRLTLALAEEQSENDYVWTQCEMMRDLRRRGEKSRTNITTLWHDILSQCDLAEVMKQTFDAISNNRIAHLRINKSRSLSLYIPRNITSDAIPEDMTSQHPFLSSAMSFGLSLYEADPIILPYYALILLEDLERTIIALQSRSSSSMIQLLRLIHPQKDLQVLAETLSLPLPEVIAMAQDLLRWRCAMPIPPLHERNIYSISPTADRLRLPQQVSLFGKTFSSGPSLPDMLELLSLNSAPYSTMIPEGQLPLYMQILAWLVRHGWLIQLRTFVWVKIRAEIKAAAMREEMETRSSTWDSENGGMHHDEAFADSILADPYNANLQESKWLRKLATYHPVADAALFLRACKYFNGKHAVEKIAVREGIDPKALRRLLEVFDEDLIKSHAW